MDCPRSAADSHNREVTRGTKSWSITTLFWHVRARFQQIVDESALYDQRYSEWKYANILSSLNREFLDPKDHLLQLRRTFRSRLKLADIEFYGNHSKRLNSSPEVSEQSMRVNPFDILRRWRRGCKMEEDDILGRTFVEYTLDIGLPSNKILIPESTELRFHTTSGGNSITIEMPGGTTLECNQNCFPPYGMLVHSDI